MRNLLEDIHDGYQPSHQELSALLERGNAPDREQAAALARKKTLAHFGDAVYIRGLVEISSHCANDCRYCGLRRSNRAAGRYRLDDATILACCRQGHALGFRTFVLQAGEDPALTDERLVPLVASIRAAHPDSAVTLSLGERSRESYRRLYAAGATRYLLRHETADAAHYALLHPAPLSLFRRTQCLLDLKATGFQTGSGFMVGSPWQTRANLADDLLFLLRLQPEMVGIGPFIPHRDTPFAHFPAGDVDLTLFLLSLVRLLLPAALIPATTALGTLAADGRERGLLAGANVVMPNLSPPWARDKYMLYNDKLRSEAEAAEHLEALRERLRAIGRTVVVDRGDYQA